ARSSCDALIRASFRSRASGLYSITLQPIQFAQNFYIDYSRLAVFHLNLSFTSRTAATLAILSQLRSARILSKSRPRNRKDAVRGQASYRPVRLRSKGRPGTGRLRVPPPKWQSYDPSPRRTSC